MKKWFLLLAMSTSAWAGFDGTWEGFCENFPNNLPNAAYTYRFSNGQMESYLQYFKDKTCAPHMKSNSVPQARGSFQIVSFKTLGAQEIYELVINYGSGSKQYQATIENNVMKLCSINPYSCWSYTRR